MSKEDREGQEMFDFKEKTNHFRLGAAGASVFSAAFAVAAAEAAIDVLLFSFSAGLSDATAKGFGASASTFLPSIIKSSSEAITILAPFLAPLPIMNDDDEDDDEDCVGLAEKDEEGTVDVDETAEAFEVEVEDVVDIEDDGATFF